MSANPYAPVSVKVRNVGVCDQRPRLIGAGVESYARHGTLVLVSEYGL